MNRVKFSFKNPDTEDHLYTVTRNEDPKTFSEFVDQVIANAPVNLHKKKVSTLYKRDCDPISVLHNHGLLNIEKTPNINDCPGSEIDVTFYTEEIRLGELVKLFSSTHKFRNGKLVYATTQEVAPQVTEEVERFNKRWQLECSPEMIKDKKIEEKHSSYTSHLSKKKSLKEMLSDLDKEQTLKRYGKTSKKDQILHHREPLNKPGCYCKKKETTYENDLRNQRKEKYFEESCELSSDCYVKEDVNIKDHRHHEVLDTQEQKPVGKKIYHAAWRQRSPQKSPSKTVRFTMEQSLKDTSQKVLKSPRETIRIDQIQASKKYSRSTIKECLQDYSSESSDYPRIYQRHAKECENEWAERMKGQKCRYPYNVRDKEQSRRFQHSHLETNEGAYTETLESHVETRKPRLETHKLQLDRTRSASPAPRIFSHCCAEGDVFLGDNEATSSDSNTSTCTIYYDCESEYTKKTSSPASRIKNDFENHKHYHHEKRKQGERRTITECRESLENVGLFHNFNKSNCKNSPKANEVLKHCCHNKKYKNKSFKLKSPPRHKQYPSKLDMECYAECRQRNKGHHQVAVTHRSVKNVNSFMAMSPEKELQSSYIRNNMVNNEALREFQMRYGNCLCFMDDLKPLPSKPREHFVKQIEKSYSHRHS